jgi:uncharacterized membrane protein
MRMTTGRLEAFSDGVIAILITIMVLAFKIPHDGRLTSLRPLIPVALTYVLSFINIGIYWNNHHHLVRRARGVNGPILWSNLHLLFWLSLIPFATGWMGQNHFATAPVIFYGVVLLGAALAYFLLQTLIVRHDGPQSAVAVALGQDIKGRTSLLIYVMAISLSFINRWFGVAGYIVVSLVWLVPDKRLEVGPDPVE